VREEVYYREALALGLDRDDAVIRRRLRQKMEFLSEGAAASVAPDEAALVAHHAAHPERFAEPPRITFRQVLLADAGEAEAARAALAGGADPEVGRGGLLPEVMEAAGEAAVDGAFGPGFFARIAALPGAAGRGRWRRPTAASRRGRRAFEPARCGPSRRCGRRSSRTGIGRMPRRSGTRSTRRCGSGTGWCCRSLAE
jgi:hypothetical protein